MYGLTTAESTKWSQDLSLIHRAHKLVIFVLEDFEKFAHQTAKRQSVLYNILDFINTPGVQVWIVPMPTPLYAPPMGCAILHGRRHMLVTSSRLE